MWSPGTTTIPRYRDVMSMVKALDPDPDSAALLAASRRFCSDGCRYS